MSVSFVLEALVVLGSIVMGTRAGGVGVGLWGGLGTFVLVFIFGEAPGEPPAAAMAIIPTTTGAASAGESVAPGVVSVSMAIASPVPCPTTGVSPLIWLASTAPTMSWPSVFCGSSELT